MATHGSNFNKVAWTKSLSDNFDFLDINYTLRWLKNQFSHNNYNLCLTSSKVNDAERIVSGHLARLCTRVVVIAKVTRITNYKQLRCFVLRNNYPMTQRQCSVKMPEILNDPPMVIDFSPKKFPFTSKVIGMSKNSRFCPCLFDSWLP